MENPKGMNLKALEKAVIDTHPNSGKKIEGIVKKIAMFKAPERYILKAGVTLEGIRKPLSESGSSPKSVRLQTPVPDAEFEKKANIDECKLQTHLDLAFDDETNNLGGGTDSHHNSPDDRKFTSNNEEKADSSSESGSDSDSESDSIDSGSDSSGQSKSGSPTGSRSGTSDIMTNKSDSESDGSSSGKEGSDVDVDIMTSDDEKKIEKKTLDAVSRMDRETNAFELGQIEVNRRVQRR